MICKALKTTEITYGINGNKKTYGEGFSSGETVPWTKSIFRKQEKEEAPAMRISKK